AHRPPHPRARSGGQGRRRRAPARRRTRPARGSRRVRDGAVLPRGSAVPPHPRRRRTQGGLTVLVPPPRPAPPLRAVLADEGFRLFFPLTALYAALWPFQWVLVFGLDLPFARTTAPGLWHAHEMIFGAFGAALLGFITTAIPEWTDTERLRGRPLYVLA